MKSFLKYTLATITGIIITSILFFFVSLGVMSALVSSGQKPVSIDDKSVLVLKAGVAIPDKSDDSPFAGIDILNMTFSPAPGLNDILRNIKKAATDDKIKGIIIENGISSSGWATSSEIREALGNFKKSGKFLIAYSDYVMTQQGYYLSSVADRIYLQPGSMLDFKGLSGEVMFYHKALEKLGVEVQVTRHGKFKGAVEPYILDKMSDENRAQINAYVGSIWKNVLDSVSLSRNIAPATLNQLADNLTGYIADDAVKARLVDGMIYRDQIEDTLKLLTGTDPDDDLKMVSMTKYSKVPGPYVKGASANKVSVIYASGDIVTGRGDGNSIGGNYYADIIRKERLDTTVKAIILRVNSPGGSALASDIMWREIALAAKAKPLIVSMGNYAASGGYYISAPATTIYADATSVSGSIGVFGLLPNAGRLLEEKLGINTEVISTNKNSDFPSVFRPMNSYEKQMMQMSIEKTYSDFVSKVAEGRRMSAAAVDSIGQGRVWSGADALKIGLVDSIGGLSAAIRGAAKQAGIDSYLVRELPVTEDPYTRLLSQLEGDIRAGIIKKELGESSIFFEFIKKAGSMSGIQARLPYFLEIH